MGLIMSPSPSTQLVMRHMCFNNYEMTGDVNELLHRRFREYQGFTENDIWDEWKSDK